MSQRTRASLLSAAAPLLLICTLATQDAATPDPTGHWKGHLTRRGQPYPIRVDLSQRGRRATVDLPDYLLYGCPARVEREGAELHLRLTLVEGTLRAELAGDRLTGTARLLGGESRLELRRVAREPRTLMHQNVAFRSGDAALAGTLVKPHGKGPFPLIVWTHGSGPDTRQTFYYHSRAHLLARNGVAGLIYDKRGAGRSTGSESWRLERLVGDALAAIAAMAERPDVDATRIGIAGFSQGGWVAPMVAARTDKVRFVVVGATPGITTGEQNVFAMKGRLRGSGHDEDAVGAAAQLLHRVYDYYRTGKDRASLVRAMAAAEPRPWYRDAAFRRLLFLPGGRLPAGKRTDWNPSEPDPAQLWRRIEVPVLSMWGADDRVVPAERSRRILERALGAAGNEDCELVVFPRASHGFWLRRTEADDWPRQAPACHATMVRWILTRTAARR